MTAFAYLPDGCDSIGIVEARLDAEKIVKRARVDSRRLEILTRHGLGETYREIADDLRLSVTRVADLAHQAERMIDCALRRTRPSVHRRSRRLYRMATTVRFASPIVMYSGQQPELPVLSDNLFCATCQVFYWHSDVARKCEQQHAAVFARLCADDEALSTAAVGKDPAPP